MIFLTRTVRSVLPVVVLFLSSVAALFAQDDGSVFPFPPTPTGKRSDPLQRLSHDIALLNDSYCTADRAQSNGETKVTNPI